MAAPTRRTRSTATVALGLLTLVLAPGPSAAQITTDDLRSFHPRSIGPAVVGGRVHDIEALPGDPSTIFVGAASGGLWRSSNRGMTWTNVFDTMAVSTFGDIAISPSNPNVVYAGTGEQNNRQSSSYGSGVYRSDDMGETWTHLGLDETRHIGRVQVHPTNPDVAYVAAAGNLWAPSEERGVYRTTDGGDSWERVLFIDRFTGVNDLVMDPSSPRILYAAAYQRQRTPWGFNGGGPGSGIWKTTDGGESWSELTVGIPSGDKGRIGLAIAESNPRVVMALVETADSEEQGTYRSEDGGASWERVHPRNGRPMYYSHIVIDPTDEDRVYTLATDAYTSADGGRSWSEIATSPTYDVEVHRDFHTLWVDPTDPRHLYLGGDAGLHESYDRGVTFSRINNFTIAQYYAIAVDMADPYNVYGGMQDNHSFVGPSETRRWIGIVNDDWRQSGFSDGMYWQTDPRDPRYAYGSSNGGRYFRYDLHTGDQLAISPVEPPGEQYRFDWTSPMMLSQHDPDVLYVAGNRLFTSPDRGGTWARTEDLSRQVDRDRLEIMGVRGSDITISRNDGTSSFGEATTLDESPRTPAVLWVGFDDGNLQVSRDAGATWTEVSGHVPGLPDGTYVSRITASSTAPGAAYATFDGHRTGDFRPWVFRTTDFGASWVPVHTGLPDVGVVNVIVEHPDNPATLFVGTEHAVFASTDSGARWAKVPNLPTTHYDDVVVHPREKDLVLGTHGRGIWIVDDTRPIAEWAAATGPVTVFSAALGTIHVYDKDTSYRGQAAWAGTNPPNGVEITYRLGAGTGAAALRVHDDAGRLVRALEVPSEPGTHRINWDLRHGAPDVDARWSRHDDAVLARPLGARGPWVAPGTFTVTVEARGTSASNTVEVRGDPRMPMISQSMYESRERFLLDALRLQDEIRTYMEENGIGGGGRGRGGRGGGPPNTPQARLQTASSTVGQVYDALTGSAVRPGSLYPPTPSQRQQLLDARTLFDRARAELGG